LVVAPALTRLEIIVPVVVSVQLTGDASAMPLASRTPVDSLTV
jgi:hypothetical protein